MTSSESDQEAADALGRIFQDAVHVFGEAESDRPVVESRPRRASGSDPRRLQGPK